MAATVKCGVYPLWSEALVTGPSGANLPVTITAPGLSGNNDYTFTNQVQEVSLQSLTVVSNSATQINSSTNWAVVKTTNANNYVVVQAVLDNTNAALWANAPNAIQWTGGQPVPGNPLQRFVSTTNSVETTVTATLGTNTGGLSVWVIWANLTIKINSSETIDPDDKAEILANTPGYWPTPQNYFVVLDQNNNGLGGGNLLGSIDCLDNTNLNYAFMIGKMEAKALIMPIGIGTLLPVYVTNTFSNTWQMRRSVITIAYTNGTQESFGHLVDDTSIFSFTFLKATNGDIFDLDTPGCPLEANGTNVNHTAEVRDNFYEYVTVNLGSGEQICSDTNTWSYLAAVDVDNPTNKVQTNVLSLSLISQQILTSGSTFSPR